MQPIDPQRKIIFKICDMVVHIGREIEKKFEDSGLKLSEFAKRINTGERNIYSIFKRKDINSALLQKVGEALDFDFFTFYQATYSKESLKPSMVEEPLEYYTPKKPTVQLTIELDGEKSTVEYWIEKIKKLNAAMA